ncbi:hypothetical protein BHE74_00029566 [Ensete ventricosum]|nr:hypothetical protein BHE74_00029566 [Ensete ventricosum]
MGENMMPHATLMARGEGVWWRSVRTPPPRMLTSRRDPSDDKVSLVVDFTIPLLRRGARAFIATIGVSVPQSLIFFIAYHTAASHHAVRGLCCEAHTYSWGMSTLLTLPMLGRSYDR